MANVLGRGTHSAQVGSHGGCVRSRAFRHVCALLWGLLAVGRAHAQTEPLEAEGESSELSAAEQAGPSAQYPPSAHAAEGDAGDLVTQLAWVPPAEPNPGEFVRLRENGEQGYLGLLESPAFAPRSYLYYGTPVGPDFARRHLLFALEYALNLPFFSDLRRKARDGKRWAGAVTLTFQGALRMLSAPSNPVRMPTYLPSLAGQLFHITHGVHPILVGLRFGVFHYSNGAEGCLFNPRLRDGAFACVLSNRGVQDPQRELNRVNGDFATSGWLLELHARIHRVNTQGVAIAHLSGGLSAWANAQRTSMQMYPSVRRLWGWGRLGFELEGRHQIGRSAVAARSAVHGYPNSGPRIPKVAGSLELEFDPYWLSGIGLFVRYYGGRDFYNAFFVDRLQQFAVGVVWQTERPLQFKRASPPLY